MFSDTALACFHNSNASTSRQLPVELSLTPLSPARPGGLGALAMGWLLRGFPLGSRPRCSPEAALRAVPWPPLPSWLRPGTVPEQGHARTLGTDGPLCAAGDGLVSSPSARAASPPRFPSPGIPWRAARSTGLHPAPSWRSSSSQASFWEYSMEGSASVPAGAPCCSLVRGAVDVSPQCQVLW